MADRLDAFHAALDALVRERFPDAEPATIHRMGGWRVPVPHPPAERDWKGTLPRTHLTILPSETRSGLTLHVWHPNAPALLTDNAAWLREAGYKPLVGCLQWNRKAEPDADALRRLLEAARDAMA